MTELLDRCSLMLEINRSSIHGYEIDTYLYVLMKVIFVHFVKLVLYLDLLTILVPENSEVLLKDDFAHIQKWAM